MEGEEKKSSSSPPNGMSSDIDDNGVNDDEDLRHESSALSAQQALAALASFVENNPDRIRHHIGIHNDVDNGTHRYNPETDNEELEIDCDERSISDANYYPKINGDLNDDDDQVCKQSNEEKNRLKRNIQNKSVHLNEEIDADEENDVDIANIKVASKGNLKDDRKYDQCSSADCGIDSVHTDEDISTLDICRNDGIPITPVASMGNLKDDRNYFDNDCNDEDDDFIEGNLSNKINNQIPKGNLKDDRKYDDDYIPYNNPPKEDKTSKKKGSQMYQKRKQCHGNGKNDDKVQYKSNKGHKPNGTTNNNYSGDLSNKKSNTDRKDYGIKRDDEYEEEMPEHSRLFPPGAYQVYGEGNGVDNQFEIQIPHATEVLTDDIENERYENDDFCRYDNDSVDHETNIELIEFRDAVNSAPLVEAIPYYVSYHKLFVIRKILGKVVLFGSIFALATGLTITMVLLTFKPPTATPILRFHQIETILRRSLQAHYNHDTLFQNHSSAEYKALMWVVRDDDLQISPSNPTRLLQRFTLACLYYSTEGDISWKHKYNFLTSTHECSWSNRNASNVFIDYNNRGIWCKGSTEHITHIWLDTNNLRGSIPNAITTLSSLQWLYMKTNRLTSTIPESIGDLVHLQGIVMNANQIEGTIPQSIGKLRNLQILTLSVNKLTGTIPLSMNNLTNLRTLEMHYNKLNGTLHLDPSKFNRLKMLMLQSNELSGEFVSSLGTGFQNIELLFLGSNKLNGTISTSISTLSKLHIFDLSNNTLHGNVPQQIWDMKNMEIFGLGDNDLSGSIPNDIGKMSLLKVFSIENNNFRGLLPSMVGNLNQLKLLSINSNHFTGSIPSSIGNIEELQALQMGDNFFNGTLPKSILNNRKLEFLSFPRTNISGNVEFLCNERKKIPVFYANCDRYSGVVCSCCVCCSQQNMNDCSPDKVYLDPTIFSILLYSTGGWHLPYQIDPLHDVPHL